MRIRRLYFRNIRNHRETELLMAPRVNVFTGLNGRGKTSVLEAISICTLGRSFVAPNDRSVVRSGERQFVARLEGESDYDVSRTIEVAWTRGAGKEITLDGSKGARAVDVVGAVPTVALFPDLKAITNGPPVHRRRFMDLVLCQAKRRYLDELMRYRRLLKQRNALLSNARRTNTRLDPDLLEPFDEGLIRHGAAIMVDRARFVGEFSPLLGTTIQTVAEGYDDVGLEYRPDGVERSFDNVADCRDALWVRAAEMRHAEARRGTTLFGPHRDEVKIELNGNDARLTASQGQHKTLLVGLKIAEFHYLSMQAAETPVILMDDIFGDLDPTRAERVYQIARGLAQVFITSVSIDMIPFAAPAEANADDAWFEVGEGAQTRRRSDTNAM